MADVPNIALRAYQLWDVAGRPEGRNDEFYYAAEEELRLLLENELVHERIDQQASTADAN